MNPQSRKSDRVEAFFHDAQEAVRALCATLRDLIRRTAPGLREAFKWSFVCYEGRGLVCGLGAFKQHVSLMFFQGARLADPDGLFNHGAGNATSRSVKFSPGNPLPTAKLARLLRAAVKLDQAEKDQPRPRLRRADLPVPDDLASALRSSPKADAFFTSLPPSCRREYIEWIVTAKRAETRARRLGAAVEMLARAQRHGG